MSKAEILAELPHLNTSELAEIQAKLDEINGEQWHDQANLSADDRAALDLALEDYRKNPRAGSPWEDVEARIQSRLKQ